MKTIPLLIGLIIVLSLFLNPTPVHGDLSRNPVQMDVFREGKAIDPDEIARILKDHFHKMAPQHDRRVEIRELRINEKIILPPGTHSCEVILPEQAHRGGSISAVLLFRVNGQEVRRVRISARVDIYAEVIASRHYLSRYHEIQERDIHAVNRNIALLPPDFLSERKDVVGKRTTIVINSGETIRTGMVEFPPLVKKGDRVMLLVENHQFKITTPGEAKEEGRRGDRIKLVNLSSKKEIYGKVLDASMVQVDF